MTMLIADGVLPSNEERGYVLRRLIRRAIRYARLAGVDEPLLVPLTKIAGEMVADLYPEVHRNRELVERVVEREEERFDHTLRQGLGLLEEEIKEAKAAGSSSLAGAVAFKLHDTYGFPLDLTADIASEEGLSVDAHAFEELMKSQRERARAARFGTQDAEVSSDELKKILKTLDATNFLAYEQLNSESTVIGLVSELAHKTVLEEGGHGEVVLESSPFYPEGGGQIGDRGEIRTETGVFKVLDTKWGIPGVIVHIGEVASGEIRKEQRAVAVVEATHREGVRQSHTATHVLHWALRHHLGEHARQQGSLVEPGRLRFDFSHFEPVSAGRLSELEEEINTRVLTDDPVRAFETTYDYAMSIGAMALFGEKYGEYVRVVEVGEYSKELCGGTHVHHTGQLGVVSLVSEGSVGAGVRRVEALTGMAGLRYLNSHVERLKQAADLLRVTPDKVVEQIEKTLETRKALEAQLTKQQSVAQKDEVRSILSENIKEFGSSRVVLIRRDGREVNELQKLAIDLRKELGSGVVVIGSAQNGRANLVAVTTRDLTEKGLVARDLLANGAQI
ncbi:MAG: alanine--tRNA ligase, partial [Acidimicrobiia bacterium]